MKVIYAQDSDKAKFEELKVGDLFWNCGDLCMKVESKLVFNLDRGLCVEMTNKDKTVALENNFVLAHKSLLKNEYKGLAE